ncbi:exodeoxyribonuclease VII large subunit [Thiomicrorhabdus indica]|uniref:exodeoxyribonuclease VII large subunit n=1 Tax=Thiomicrorhabdus indica TaxID=2267253 RepID=UPI002AA7A90C|nr:exodeoxyribonuclease VII large subunit [Thiomicrorhabdus indica]
MRYLNVPFSQKDEAKALGARWDAIARRWYIPQALLNKSDKFSKWFLEESESILSDSQNKLSPSSEPVSQPNEQVEVGIDLPINDSQDIDKPQKKRPNQDYTSHIEHQNLARENQAITLSGLLNKVKSALLTSFVQAQWLIAEVANVQLRNGHYYLELTQTDSKGRQLAKTRAMIWSRTAQIILPEFEKNTGKSIETGQKLLMLVNVNFHEQYGFSLQIEDIDASFSLGEMERALVELREKLRQEKRLESNKVYRIPDDFFRIAVVAPPKAAGLGDFKVDADRLEALGLCTFVYFTASFQGEKVLKELSNALNLIQSQILLNPSKYDAVVIIRGGGAKLDLQYLNQYAIAKSLSELQLPVITGIGHEKDNCILDEMAAMRCDTPSKVVHFIRGEIINNAQTAQKNWLQIQQRSQFIVKKPIHEIERLLNQVKQNSWQVWQGAQAKLAPLSYQIARKSRQTIETQKHYLKKQQMQISSLATQAVQLKKHLINQSFQGVVAHSQNAIEYKQQSIKYSMQIILNSGPQTQMQRGFAITKNSQGKLITSVKQGQKEQQLTISYQDGDLNVQVLEFKQQS